MTNIARFFVHPRQKCQYRGKPQSRAQPQTQPRRTWSDGSAQIRYLSNSCMAETGAAKLESSYVLFCL